MPDDPVNNGDVKPEVGAGLFQDDVAKTAEAKAVADKAAADKATADAKAAEDAKAKTEADAKAKVDAEKKVVPEKYELKTPEGSKLSAQDVEEIASHCKERGFSQEEAQKQLDRESKLKAKFETDSLAQLDQLGDEWYKQSEADKEIGGEHVKENFELAKRAFLHFSTPEFAEIVASKKLGNHPEFVRAWLRVGKAMGDDKFVKPGSQTKETQDIAQKFYGDPNKKE